MLSATDRRFVKTLSELTFENPFQPKRLELEQIALGDAFEPEDYIAWSKGFSRQANERPNVCQLNKRAEKIVERMRTELHSSKQVDQATKQQYQDLVSYILYYRYLVQFDVEHLFSGSRLQQKMVSRVWKKFYETFQYFFWLPKLREHEEPDPAHWFATFFQVRRAFLSIFENILGESLPAVKLRAMVWQSVFTHDMRRYRRSLYSHMRELTTLITGPSGTGKELVARAISRSQYLAFDAEKGQFVDDLNHVFSPVNLSALSPTLIESELFGHCKGAFTGAIADRKGWLECCPAHGAVFLDEIGELDPAVQVKLLRVVQDGKFSRIGEVNQRQFAGKLIVATHRDLAAEMQAGRFREDLYYRICSDRITTPSLRDQLLDRPEALRGLISFISQNLVESEAEALTDEVEAWINQHVGPDYHWPGNIRELEQCVRNVLVRQEYRPQANLTELHPTLPSWLREIEQGTLSHAELLSRYCTSVYAKLGNYQQAAEVLGLDRRTVRSKVDEELLEQLR